MCVCVCFITLRISHRQGEDLIITMTIQLVESLCGFQKPVVTMDNRTLLVTSHPGEHSYIYSGPLPGPSVHD